MNPKSLLLLIALVCTTSLHAQENHHWAQAMGAKAAGLGGAQVAADYENTATFYNPGGLGFITHSGLSVSANIYKLAAIQIQDGAGADLNLRSLRFTLIPPILSGALTFKKNDKWKASYLVIPRYVGNEKIVYRHEMDFDAIPQEPGNEEIIGDLNFDSDLIDMWLGFGLARRINDHLSVGLSTFFSYRNQRLKQETQVKSIILNSNDFYTSIVSTDQDIVFDEVKFLWKAGLAYKKEGFRLGLTFTTPSMSVLAFGNLRRELSVINSQGNNPRNNSGRVDIIGSDRQRNIRDAGYKLPWSASAGVSYAWQRSHFMLAVEYFHHTGIYNIITPEARPFIRPSNIDIGVPEDEFLAVVQSTRSVTNMALGFSQQLKKPVSLLFGFRTDFSYYNTRKLPDDFRMSFTPLNYDLMHYSMGFTWHQLASDFTVALTYSRGFNIADQEPLVRFDRPDEAYGAVVAPIETTTNINAFTIALGYTYFFRRGEAAE